MYYILVYIQPKKQFKVQIIGILEEIDSFIDLNAPLENVTKKLGRALPLIWTKSKRTAVFFSGERPLALLPLNLSLNS